jgi:hypothetical protein
VSGTKNQQSREGEYFLTNGICQGRQVYSQPSRNNYIFYTGNNWMIGPLLCAKTGGISAYENTIYPEDVTAVWREVNGSWKKNADIKVACKTGTACNNNNSLPR